MKKHDAIRRMVIPQKLRVFSIVIFSLFFISIPHYGTDFGLNFPSFEKITLDNGLSVYIAEHHEQPTVYFRLMTGRGRYHDPKEFEGLSSLFNAMLAKGTTTKSAEEISEEIAYLGGSLGASSGLEMSTVACNVLSKDTDKGLALFADIVMNPIFPDSELSLLKRQTRSDMKERYSDNRYLSRSHSYNVLLGDSHPLGREETERSISSINREKLKSVYEDVFQTDKVTLLVLGDFEKHEMVRKIRKTFEAWQTKKTDYLPKSSVIFNSKKTRRIVNKPDLTQGYLTYISEGISRRSQDYPAFMLLNDILCCGFFSSRLRKSVRVKGGKTYGAASVLETRSSYGFFRIVTFTRNDEIVSTHKIILSELEKLRLDGITDEELTLSKSHFFGGLPLGLESPSSLLSFYSYYLFHGYSLNDIYAELQAIHDVTKEDVQNVINRMFHPDRFHHILLGDYAQIKESIDVLGEAQVRYYKNPL